MLKKILFAFVLLFLAIFTIFSLALAAEMTVFGPKQYTRTSGAPDVFNDSFSGNPGEGKLIVRNGQWDGDKRVTDAIDSAKVFVNGEQIFGPSDFNEHVYYLEVSTNLVDNNYIRVELRSDPGSYLAIEVTQETVGPTVSINADPASIRIGESSTLSWNSTNADSATIDREIGEVPVDGTRSVSPTQTTTYTITVTGAGGIDSASVTVTVISPISTQITSPSDGELISAPFVNVQGTVSNTTGNETGITINGMIATVNGDKFVSNHIPLEEGENAITATGRDTAGNTATASITLNAVTTGDYIRITADTESGVSPLETTLKIEGSFIFTAPSLTYTGPGVVEFLESPDENQYKYRVTGEGVYYFTAEVTDIQNNTHTDIVAVVVLDKAELDALLTAKWEEMRGALAQNNIDSAVSYFADLSKDRYRELFTALSLRLPQIAQELSDIQLIRMMKNSVEYDIRTTRDGKEYSFYLLFVRDKDGLWKIRSF